MADTDDVREGQELVPDEVVDDELEWDAFDDFLSARMRMALDTAGPSAATEDRILSAILATIAPAAAEVPLSDPEATIPVAVSVPEASPLGSSGSMAAVVPTVDPAASLADPVVPQAPVQPSGPALALVPPDHDLVTESKASATTTDLSEVNERLKASKGGLRLTGFRRSLAIAACVAAFVATIGISSWRDRRAHAPMSTMDAGSSKLMMEEAAPEEAADGGVVFTDGYVENDEAEAEAVADLEPKAPEPTDDVTEDEDVDAVEEEAEEIVISLAAACPNIKLSDGVTLRVASAEGNVEPVDPTALGEFVEQTMARSDDGTQEVPCEVYHLIAQSGEDGGLYAVRFLDDGSLWLASRSAASIP